MNEYSSVIAQCKPETENRVARANDAKVDLKTDKSTECNGDIDLPR